MPVSVCLCTYNGGRYLKDMLTSLAAQTLLPAELSVGDDGSSDDTLKFFGASLPKRLFRLRFSRTSAVSGPLSTSNASSRERRATSRSHATRTTSGTRRR